MCCDSHDGDDAERSMKKCTGNHIFGNPFQGEPCFIPEDHGDVGQRSGSGGGGGQGDDRDIED